MGKQKKRQEFYQSSERSGKATAQWLNPISSAFQAIRNIAKPEDKPAEKFVVSGERTEPALLQQGRALIRQLKPLLRELYKKPQKKTVKKLASYKEEASGDEEAEESDSGSLYEPSDNESSSSSGGELAPEHADEPKEEEEEEADENDSEVQDRKKSRSKKRKVVIKTTTADESRRAVAVAVAGGPMPGAPRLPFAAGDLLNQAKKLKAANDDAEGGESRTAGAVSGSSTTGVVVKRTKATAAAAPVRRAPTGVVTAEVLQSVSLRKVNINTSKKKQLVPPSTRRVRLRGNASGKKGIPRQTSVGDIRTEESSSKTIGQFLRKALEDKFKAVRQMDDTPNKGDEPWSPSEAF